MEEKREWRASEGGGEKERREGAASEREAVARNRRRWREAGASEEKSEKTKAARRAVCAGTKKGSAAMNPRTYPRLLRSCAQIAISTRLRAPSFAIRLARCVFTVLSVM